MKDQAFIQQLNERLRNANLAEVLTTVSEIFGEKIAFATSLGFEDQVITHHIAKHSPKINIFTLDTGRVFPETYDVLDRTNARYKMQIKVMFPDYHEVEKMVNEKGINLFYDSIENRKMCCNVRKTKPLLRALYGLDAWITGLRREQAVTRTGMQMIELDEMHQLVKINPLIDWTEKMVTDFVKQENIPYNKLHDKGFPSIGCQPCTRAIEPGEDIRAGRWWWEQPEQKECGLHKS